MMTTTGHRTDFQFRLCGILLGLTVLSVGLAWIARCLVRDRAARDCALQSTIDKILADQGKVDYWFTPRRNWIGAICGDTARSIRHLRVPPTVSIRDVAAFRSLETLEIGQAKPGDLVFVRHMNQLRSLTLRGNCVHSLVELRSMPKLEELHIELNTLFNDCDSLTRLTQLKRLSLVSTSVVDIGPLEKLVNLRTLHLAGTRVSTLNPVARLRKLVNLFPPESVCDADLAALSNLKQLRVLDLRSCDRVTDLSALRQLPSVFVLVKDTDRVRIPKELIGRVHWDVRELKIIN